MIAYVYIYIYIIKVKVNPTVIMLFSKHTVQKVWAWSFELMIFIAVDDSGAWESPSKWLPLFPFNFKFWKDLL